MTEEPSAEAIEERARKLEHGGEGHESLTDDRDAARRAAEQMLRESEERVADPATTDRFDDDAIRRSSEDTV
ncbi:MAG: hypothetical protein M3454_09290 [Actinomycetota bacterium]|nr:hypothetical protein [Actinomycetota bacterium]